MRKGRRFAGRYRLADRIGVGGMAQVWRATDEVLARQVAVKLIEPALLDDPGFRARFRAEAQAAAGLSHPCVVTVHDYGEEDGTPYIVMELLDGETLADRLTRGPLPPGEAAGVCGQVAAALAGAHEAGVTHRDVKPGNVFLTRDGVKVLDFGIAVQDDSGPPMGTVPYMAPEQLARRPVTQAADVFALGVVLFEALTGWTPFAGLTPRTEPPPFPPGTPAGLADLGERCLSVEPAARPTAAEVAAVLGSPSGAASTSHGAAPEDPVAPSGPRPRTRVLDDPAGVRRRRRRLAVGGGGAAIVVVLVAAVFLPTGRDQERPGPAITAPSAIASAPAGTDVALTRMRQVVDQGAAAGEVRSDVALDFSNLIGDLQARLAAGETVDLGAQVRQLRVKIDQRLREGGLSERRAQELTAALSGMPAQ